VPVLIDVTVPIRPGMFVYPGDPEVRFELVRSMARGDDANVTRLDLGAHTGTHADAPGHVIQGGDGIDALALDALVGEAWVADATGLPGDLDAQGLAGLGIPEDVERLLLRTRNSELWARDRFEHDFVVVAPDGAEALVARGLRLVGIDYLSVGTLETHLALLGAGTAVVEGLDLRRAPSGPCHLICLPMRLEGVDGAPARVLLEVGGSRPT
jgi:arylformamidase